MCALSASRSRSSTSSRSAASAADRSRKASPQACLATASRPDSIDPAWAMDSSAFASYRRRRGYTLQPAPPPEVGDQREEQDAHQQHDREERELLFLTRDRHV